MPSQMYIRTPPPTGMKAPPRKSVAIIEEGTLDGFGTWRLDVDGLLTIEGNGRMPDWTSSWDTETANTPWWNRRDQVKAAVVSEGVTTIGSYAFYGCSSLTGIRIPNSVTSINRYAFQKCSSLNSITIPEGVTLIGSGAFACCSSLASVRLPKSVENVGHDIFRKCRNLRRAWMPSHFNMWLYETHMVAGNAVPTTFKDVFGIPRRKVTFF